MAALPLVVEELFARAKIQRGDITKDSAPPLVLDWPALDDALPDGGLPRAVIQLQGGGATSVALAAVRAAQAKDARAWCAWIDAGRTLYAPGIAGRGVELHRLLVVRPERSNIARVAVKLATSGAFEIVVVDWPQARRDRPSFDSERGRAARDEVLVRKLALAAEQGTMALLITSAGRPLPVALRLELARPSPEELSVHVAKDRHGRIGLKKTVPFSIRKAV